MTRKPLTPPTRDLNLLPFPPEIRTIIYNYVFTSTTPFDRNSNISSTSSQKFHYHRSGADTPHTSYPCSNIHSSLDLSLLLVSRHTYFETFHMYYALNTIQLCSTGRLFYFLTRMGYARRQQLVSIAFHIFDKNAKRAFLVLRTAKRLQHLKFHLPGDSPRQGGYLVPGIAALREVRGLSRVEITSSYDCSDLIAAMMRPRLSRYTLKATDKVVELFKPPREIFPKTEAQRLRIAMNWTFGTTLCVTCKKLGAGSCKLGENRGVDHSRGVLAGACTTGCVCGKKLGQGGLR